MHLQSLIEQWLLKRADQWVARRHQPRPSISKLTAARLVAHRGVYDNRQVFENSLVAFERFRRVGGWGIELDIRWTRDGEPVVSHDPDGWRLFGIRRPISDMSLATLQNMLPLVPTLEAVVTQFGGHLHLMVEIKTDPHLDVRRQRESLAYHLMGLSPGQDFHLLSLDSDRLRRLRFSPPQSCIPIAYMNLRPAFRAARMHAWGGIAGHYALIRSGHILALKSRGIRVGTGYVNSRQCLYREVARGVDWLFSDQPLALQRMLTSNPAEGHRQGEDHYLDNMQS